MHYIANACARPSYIRRLHRAAKITETLPGGSYETSFTYANDDAVTKVQFGSTSKYVNYAYDGFRRITGATTPLGRRAFSYFNGGHGTTSRSTRVSKITEMGKTWEYGYDTCGLITSEKRGGTSGQSVTYEYDHLGQLVRTNDPFFNAT
ncbi:MAG: hypothetical protein LBD16_00360 [Oscillospiraceae bacterium]|nr:hypothetical protein [Oscillospiraceae bacterium]